MNDDALGGSGEQVAGGEVRSGVAWIGTALRPVEYTVVEGRAVVEGCIILGTAEEVEELTERAASHDRGVEHFGTTIIGPQYRWANKIVPYQIHQDLPDQERVTQAIDHWIEKTPLRFVRRDSQNAQLYRNWISFVPAEDGCGSMVGCQGGEQFIHLAANCQKGNIIHEIGHAIGLFHEQCRNDREDWVEVILDRVPQRVRHNFTQNIRNGEDQGIYDYGSIMHYPPTAFTTDHSVSIRATRPGGEQMGQRVGLSAGDVAAVRAIYP